MIINKRGDIEFNTVVYLIIIGIVLIICIGMIVFFKDVLWDKFSVLKETFSLG